MTITKKMALTLADWQADELHLIAILMRGDYTGRWIFVRHVRRSGKASVSMIPLHHFNTHIGNGSCQCGPAKHPTYENFFIHKIPVPKVAK